MQQGPQVEPPPAATLAVQRLLDEATAEAAAGRFEAALGIADRALEAAKQSRDLIGVAIAHRSRASALTRIGRGEDALTAWRWAEESWNQAGEGPGQVQALLNQAVLLLQQEPARTEALLTRAIEMVRVERVRPRAALTTLIEAGPQLVTREPREAQRIFDAVRAIEEASGNESLELALAFNGLGAIAGNSGDLVAGRQYHERALAIRERLAPGSVGLIGNLNSLAQNALRSRDLDRARAFFQRAVAIGEVMKPIPLAVGTTLTGLGDLADGLEARLSYYQRALAVRETAAPGSVAVADSLHDIGQISAQRGDLAEARELYGRSLAVYDKLTPNSLESTRVLNSLGVLSRRLGDVDAALEYYKRAFRIRETLTPNSPGVATMLNNLGFAAREKGDLRAAREYLERSLAIVEGTSNSLQLASALNNVGLVVKGQGDLSAARQYFERAIAIEQSAAPTSTIVANYINNLANVLAAEGDLDAARSQHERVLAIRTKGAPKSHDVGVSLNNLAALEEQAGNLAAARDHATRALAIWTELAPQSLEHAECLQSLAAIARAEGDAAAARSHYLQALAIQESRAPSSLATIGTLQALAAVAQLASDKSAALAYATRAWGLVRAQAALVSGDEARQAFAVAYQSFATQAIRIQLAAGDPDAAFAILEEGRAQALLQAIAGRGIARRLAPPDLLQRFDRAQADANRAGTILERAGAAELDARLAVDLDVAQLSDPAVVEQKRRAWRQARDVTVETEKAYTRARVEAEARWAEIMGSLEAVIPPPLSLAEARKVLPRNTVFASFAVGSEASVLFLVTGDGQISAFDLPIRAEVLDARTRVVRAAIGATPPTRGLALPTDDARRVQASRELFQILFPPAAREAIARADRLVLSPDGVLWDLPFAALVTNPQGAPTYLGLEKPLSYAQSLTTLAQSAHRPAAATSELLLVGNPLYERPAPSASIPTRVSGERALMTSGSDVPPPLPFAEQEVKEIAALYKTRASIGAEPTEAWFRAHAARARVIHLATHGYFNPMRAVSSGLWLAVPDDDSAGTDNDGALQAWEVLTQLRLQADLVILSACETGVGAKVAAEGLVGLTRAFQVAGAASVVATQWKVVDRSTARAMVEFHRRLLSGHTRGDALFHAIRAVAADRTTAHPYHWAPFMLVGDFGLPR